ncbi:hypothetical protein EC991_001593 [Linnemannia zychae]|nr:hypothetical protein EC991_001593 [Linnemannia zychae]
MATYTSTSFPLYFGNFEQKAKYNLFHKFELWKEGGGFQSWLDRQSECLAKNTATHLIKGLEPYAEQSIRRASSRAQSTMTLSTGAPSEHDLEDTGETYDMHNNPLKGVDPASTTNGVDDANQVLQHGTP